MLISQDELSCALVTKNPPFLRFEGALFLCSRLQAHDTPSVACCQEAHWKKLLSLSLCSEVVGPHISLGKASPTSASNLESREYNSLCMLGKN